MDSSAECQLNLHNQYKTVVHGSKDIILAPLNFTYDGIRQDVQDGQIEVSENLFDEFVHWSGPKAESVPRLVGILRPLAFEFETLPFSTSKFGRRTPWKLPLPEEYAQSMKERDRVTTKLREFLGSKGAAVSGKIQRRLMDWIQESGQMPVLRQYVGLTADVQGISVESLDETKDDDQ